MSLKTYLFFLVLLSHCKNKDEVYLRLKIAMSNLKYMWKECCGIQFTIIQFKQIYTCKLSESIHTFVVFDA